MLALTESKGEHVPPQTVRASAKRGLEMHRNGEAGDGLESATVARARRIAAGDALTDSHVRRMHSFFERHDKTRPADGGSGKSPWRTAWMLWGGNAGRRWAASVAKSLDESEWGLNIGALVVVPDGDEDDVLILEQQPVPPGPPLEEAAAKAAAKTVALIKDAVKTQPRWPKKAPMGKGGEFMRVGERFNYNNKTYEITSIIDGRVTAQIATGTNLPDEIHLTKDEAEAKIEPAAPESYKVSGSKKFVKNSKNQVTIDPFVHPETHDPSLPKPAWLAEEEWKRFGSEDQRNILYLEERFGKWEPGASPKVINELSSQYSAKIRQYVKSALIDQYGGSSGDTLNLADLAAKIDPDSPNVADQVKDYEQAKLLLRDTAEAIQWDLYHRTKSPDVAAFHRGGSSHSSKFFAEKVPVMSAWSWSTSWHVWQGDVVNIVPLAIRHVEMHTHSGGVHTTYESEHEITTGARMSLEQGKAIVAYDKNLPASVRQYLAAQTKSKQPTTGAIVNEALLAISDPSHELELPPQPSLLKQKGGTKADAIQPIPAALGKQVVNAGAEAGYAPGGEQTLKAMVADGLKPGDFIEGLKGTRYVVVKDDSDSSAGLAYMKVGTAGSPLPEPDMDKAYSFSSSYENNFRRLDAHVDLPKPEAEDGFVPMPEATQKALSPMGEAQMIQKMPPKTLVNVDGGIYEVSSASPNAATLISVDTGKEFSVNPVFKTEPLTAGVVIPFNAIYGQQIIVMRDGVPSVAYYMDPEHDSDGKQTGNIHVLFPNGSGPEIVDGTTAYNIPASHYAPDGFEVGDQFSKDGKKWTVTSMLKDGTVRAKPSGGKVVKFAPPYDDIDETTHIRPDDWSLGEPTKAKELAVGDLISGSKVKVRPYRVLEVSADGKTVKLMNLETGEFAESTGGKSWPRLLTKVSPESETVADAPSAPDIPEGVVPLGPTGGESPDPAVVAANLTVWFRLAEPGAEIRVGAGQPFLVKSEDGSWYAPGGIGAGESFSSEKVAETLQDWTPDDGQLTLATAHMSEPAGSGMTLPVEDYAVKGAQLAGMPEGSKVGGWGPDGWREFAKEPGGWRTADGTTKFTDDEIVAWTTGSVVPLQKADEQGGGDVALEALQPGTVVSVGDGGPSASFVKTASGTWVKPGGLTEKFSSAEVADATKSSNWAVVQTPEKTPEPGETVFATENLITAAPQGAILQDPTGNQWTKQGDDWDNGQGSVYGNFTMADYDPHEVIAWPDGKTSGALTQAQFEALPAPEQLTYLDDMPEESVIWDDDGHRWAKDAAGYWVSNTAGGSGATTDTAGLILNHGPLLAGFGEEQPPAPPTAAPAPGENVTAEQIADAPLNTVLFGPSIAGVGDDYWWKVGPDTWQTGSLGDEYQTSELQDTADTYSSPMVVQNWGELKSGAKVPATAKLVDDAPTGTILAYLDNNDDEIGAWTKLDDGRWRSNLGEVIAADEMTDNSLHKIVQWGMENDATDYYGLAPKGFSSPIEWKLEAFPAGTILKPVPPHKGPEWKKNGNGKWVRQDTDGEWGGPPFTLTTVGLVKAASAQQSDEFPEGEPKWGGAAYEWSYDMPEGFHPMPEVSPMAEGAKIQLPDGSHYQVVKPPTELESGVFKVIHDGNHQPGSYVTLGKGDVYDAVPSNATVEEITPSMLPPAWKSDFEPFTYATYGKIVNEKLGDLPVGSVFTDKSKKKWMVKVNGSEPVITDGFNNYSAPQDAFVRSLNDSVAADGTVSAGNKVGSTDELKDAPVGTKVKFSSPLVADNAVWQKTGDDLWETDFGDGPVEASNDDMEAGLGSLSFLKTKAPFVDNSPPLTATVEQTGPEQDVLSPFKYASWGDTKFDEIGTAGIGTEFEDKTKTKYRVVAHVGEMTVYENLATGQQFTTSSANRVRVLSGSSANVA